MDGGKNKVSTKKQTTYLPGIWRKPWLWHLLFSSAWTLCVNGHIFAHFSQQCAVKIHISSEAGANGYHTREVCLASIHSQIQEHLWSLAISADGVTPVCSSSKYFLGVTHVPRSRCELSRPYLSCTHCSGVCLHVILRILNNNHKKGWKSSDVCLNNGRKRYAAPSWVAEEVGCGMLDNCHDQVHYLRAGGDAWTGERRDEETMTRFISMFSTCVKFGNKCAGVGKSFLWNAHPRCSYRYRAPPPNPAYREHESKHQPNGASGPHTNHTTNDISERLMLFALLNIPAAHNETAAMCTWSLNQCMIVLHQK